MSIVQTVLVFVGIPALVFGLLAVLTLAPHAARRPRYRPGEPWDYEPVWYVPQARPEATEHGAGQPAVEAGHRAPALTAGPAMPTGQPATPVRTAKGGVHDSW